MQQSIDNLKTFQKQMQTAATQTKDVKDGVMTPDEEKQEPSYILFNEIIENSIKILQMPTMVEGFSVISEKLGEDATKKLIEMMAVAMNNSAYAAIALYDARLKNELRMQFDNYGNSHNKLAEIVNGMNGAMEVFKRKIGDLEKKDQLQSMK